MNLRGTGCSGGTLSFFEGAQIADGYDVVEAIAAQDWVANNEVGMVGISYPGITQLFVASTQPPHLAAITPMSVIDDAYDGVGYPGGIFNSGFAQEWTSHVSEDAAAYGPDYVNQQIDEGDTDCDANQALRSQNLDLVAGLEAEPYFDEARLGPVSPETLVDRIEVPVFLTGQWQDEQTSGHFADMLDRFTGTDQLHVFMTNGPHGDGLTLPNFQRWTEFLDLYVARRVPSIPDVARLGVPDRHRRRLRRGGRAGPGPLRRRTTATTRPSPSTRPTLRSPSCSRTGRAPTHVGGPGGTTEATFDQWPPPEAEAQTLWFQPDGTLGDAEPDVADGEDGSVVEYAMDPDQADDADAARAVRRGLVLPRAALPVALAPAGRGGHVADAGAGGGPRRHRARPGSTCGCSPARPTPTSRSRSPRSPPTGDEVYVQTGWLRASHRALDEEQLVRRSGRSPCTPRRRPRTCPADEFVDWSRSRSSPSPTCSGPAPACGSSIDSPGGNRARWAFDTVDVAGGSNLVATSADYPSSLTIGVVPGVDVPRALPACGTLRAQPCRPYEAVENVPGG